MRSLLVGCVAGLALAASAGADAPARAGEGLFPWQIPQHYPWCAFDNAAGRSECLYYNVAQCRASVSGVGGFCYRNRGYVAPPPPVRRPHVRPHHRHRRS